MDTHTLHQGRFLRLCIRDGWEFCDRVNASAVVTIVAVTDAGELLLTEQYRPPFQAPVIELPAGLAGDEDALADESVQAAAARELEEETGYRAGRWRHLTDGPSSAGLSTEHLHFLGAGELERVGPGGGCDGEDITVHAVPVDAVAAFLDQRRQAGVLVDPKVYAGLYFVTQSRRTG